VCACTINALQGNVPAIKLALGVAILTHCTSFLANNVSTTIVRYSVEWPVNLLSASWLSCQRVDCQRVDLSARCLWSFPTHLWLWWCRAVETVAGANTWREGRL